MLGRVNLLSLLVFVLFSLCSTLSATESKHRLFGNDNFDFSSPASCIPKQSSSISKLEEFSKNIDSFAPVILNINGKSCLVHDENKAAANAILHELISSKNNQSQKKLLKKAFPANEIKSISESRDLQSCDKDEEKWVISSFAQRKLQPYNIAGYGVSHLAEIKLLIAGGGIAAGLLGDSIGATCMTIIGAGVDYACNKGWLYDK